MLTTALLIGLLLAASYTDIRWRVVKNANVYPGILLAIGLNLLATLFGWDANQATDEQYRLLGFVGLADSLIGFLVCGVMMLVCYVAFAGQVGGGDVKLIAMIGAFLGLYAGMETMLWTFIIAACMALILLVWQIGFWQLLKNCFNYFRLLFRARGRLPLSEEDRKPLRAPLFLAPSALAAVLVVQFQLL